MNCFDSVETLNTRSIPYRSLIGFPGAKVMAPDYVITVGEITQVKLRENMMFYSWFFDILFLIMY